MCGIAGIFLKPGSSISEMQKRALLQALIHRGPDGHAIWEHEQAVLIHTRLSIMDVEGGKQPFLSDHHQVLIVNGEIYNSPELRDDFPDYPYQTESDCEVILPLWQRFHAEYGNSLRGMYGLALVDVNEKTSILSRDPLGIKPLYYTDTEQGLVFASEIQAIVKAGFVRPVLYDPAVHSLLQVQFSPGRETVYQGVFRLLPGETLVVQEGKRIHDRRVSWYERSDRKITDEAEALSMLDRVLEASVRIHERSDVPFGLFLSSGIDSTILLNLMRRLGQDRALHVWTANFEMDSRSGQGADESEQAARMARQAGAIHHVTHITQQQVWQNLPRIIACMDDPAADYAIIPTWFLAREASSMVKVILSGEGGDELFAGYGRYRKAMRPRWMGGKSMYGKGVFPQKGFFRKPLLSWRQQFFQDGFSGLGTGSRLERAQKLDIQTWLPDDLLIKLDRCLMSHAIEGRVPFLDKKVAEFAFSLADNLKIRHGQGKWILRKWLELHCPQAQPFARKKGFTVPMGAWIEQRSGHLAFLVAKQPGIQEIVSADRLCGLFERASDRKKRFMAWNLLFYAVWHQVHVMGKSTEGNVFEVLAG